MLAEQCLRVDAGSGAGSEAGSPAVLLVPPLFEEANRMRRTLVLTMRALAAMGVASLLPDLPGQNDSLVRGEAVTLTSWREALAAMAAAEARPMVVASWRGGALIDDAVSGAAGWWRMAPLGGAAIVRTMMRVRIAGDKEAGRAVSSDQLRGNAARGPLELAGHMLSAAMIAQLDAAVPVEVTPLRLTTPADVGGSALWLRAEPGEDAAMAQAMAADLAGWTRSCVAG